MKHDLPKLDLWLEENWGVKPPPAATTPLDFTVSVVIPSHRRSPIGLEAFLEQDCVSEVFVLANGDLNLSGDHILQVPWQGHGQTRQEAVSHCSGDYILFSVDDALPRGRGCVRTLVEALRNGPFQAVTGRQIPWPESDRLTQERLANWTPAGTTPVVWPQVDHVFALYAKETLLQHPLPNVPIGEDLHWSQGKQVGYVPSAPIVHAHPRRARALYRRTRALHIEYKRLGHPATVPDLPSLLRALPSALLTSAKYGPRELPNQLAELLGQWRGAAIGKSAD